MILRDRRYMAATPERVWAILADPALMELWNPKCVRCEADRENVHVGLRFKAVFRLSGPEREAQCEIVDCQPDVFLAVRFSGDAFRRAGYVDETFRMTPTADGTRIIHEVDFTHSGLPWLLKVFVKVMDTIGYKAGKSSLDGIKELAEQSSHPSHAE